MRVGLGIALTVLCLCPVACGDSDQQRPSGPLADTLAEIGGGGEHGSLGIGWTEPQLARRAGLDPELIARALGPNAQSVVEAAPALRRVSVSIRSLPAGSSRSAARTPSGCASMESTPPGYARP